MNSSSTAKALTLLGLLALGSATWGQTFDRPSAGQVGRGSIFSGRSALGSTLRPGTRSQFGSGRIPNVSDEVAQDTAAYGRDSRRPGDFVGTSADDVRNFTGVVQAQGAAGPAGSGLQGTAGLAGFSITAGARRPAEADSAVALGSQGQLSSRVTPPIRTRLRVAFEFTPHFTARVGTQLTQRLTNSPSIRSLGPIQVEMEGRKAILRGRVVSEQDRDLVERMARLEAGIEQVQNEVVVAASSPASEPSLLPEPGQ